MREQLYAWEPQSLLAYLDRIENASASEIKIAASYFDDDEDEDSKIPEKKLGEILDPDGTATIHIDGPLSMNGPSPLARLFGFSGTAYRDIMAWGKGCKGRSEIKQVVLAINSPGGEVAGVDQSYQVLRDLGITKPVTAINCGLMASAAYWLACAAGKVYAEAPSCEQGSIGVVIAGIDDSQAAAKLGMKRVSIVSRNAPNKAADFSTAKGRATLQDRADAMERQFMTAIARGRDLPLSHIEENFGRGSVMVAEDPDQTVADAISVRMIDGVTGPMALSGIRKNILPAGVPVGSATSGYMHVAGTPSASYTTTTSSTSGFPPVTATTPEVRKMTLKEILAANPEAQAEIDKLVAEAIGKVKAAVAKVRPLLVSGKYNANPAIMGLGFDAIEGTKSLDAFEVVVSMEDAAAEKAKQKAAEQETPPDTHQIDAGITDAGKAAADEVLATMNKIRASQGQKPLASL